MKRYIFFLLVCWAAIAVHAQNEPLFIFEQFLNAKIHFKNRSVTVAPMNYDASNDKMYFKRDGDLMELVQLEKVDSIVWKGKLCFVPHGRGFLEKVSLAHGVAFIHWRIRNLYVGARGALGAITQAKVERIFSADKRKNYHTDIYRQKNSNDYYLQKDNSLKKVSNLKQLLKLYPQFETEIKAYVDQQKVDMDIPQSVLDLLDYCLKLNAGR